MEFNAAKLYVSMLQNYRMVAVSPSYLETTELCITSGAFDLISVFLHCWRLKVICYLAFY